MMRCRAGRLSRDDDSYKQVNDVYKVFTHTEHSPVMTRPAEGPGHDVGSVVSKLKRSSRYSPRCPYLSRAALVERLYRFPWPLKREKSKPPNAAEQDSYLVIFDGRTERESIRE